MSDDNIDTIEFVFGYSPDVYDDKTKASWHEPAHVTDNKIAQLKLGKYITNISDPGNNPMLVIRINTETKLVLPTEKSIDFSIAITGETIGNYILERNATEIKISKYDGAQIYLEQNYENKYIIELKSCKLKLDIYIANISVDNVDYTGVKIEKIILEYDTQIIPWSEVNYVGISVAAAEIALRS